MRFCVLLPACICVQALFAQDSAGEFDFSNLPASEKVEQAESAQDKRDDKRLGSRDVFQYFQRIKVVSSSKVEQSLFETPGNVLVFDRDHIAEQAYFDLNELLYYQAGFMPAQGTERRTIASRGLHEDWNNTHYLLLIDGLPYNDNSDGSAHTWEVTPLHLAKQIEIIRGPGSALYGSNAMNGVISLTTLSGRDMNGGFDLRTRYGSMNTLRTDLVAGNQIGFFQYLASASYFSTAGNSYPSLENFDHSSRFDDAGNPLRFPVNDKRNARHFLLKLQGVDKWENLQLTLQHQAQNFRTFDGWDYQINDEWDYNIAERNMLALHYRSPATQTFAQEYAVRYQAYRQVYSQFLGVDNSYSGFYPDGIQEHLDTTVHDIFGRAQFSLKLPQRSVALVGTEATVFGYYGDDRHVANFDPNDPDFSPWIEGTHPDVAPGELNFTRRLGDFFAPIRNKPVMRTSAYAQYLSGNLLRALQFVLGARYDRLQADYTWQEESRQINFQNISPRAALIFLPTETFSLKLLGGQAFRDPAIVELFSSNSWFASANPLNLKPERITTVELIALHQLPFGLRWQIGGFWNRFQNVISYDTSAGQNTLNNLYTTESAGGEADLVFERGRFKVTFGYGYALRLREEAQSENFVSENNLTEYAPHSAKATVSWQIGAWLLALRTMAYTEVARRAGSDLSYVPARVPSYVELAARVLFQPVAGIQAGVEGRNLLNQEQFTIASGAVYDYRREMRSFYGFVRIAL